MIYVSFQYFTAVYIICICYNIVEPLLFKKYTINELDSYMLQFQGSSQGRKTFVLTEESVTLMATWLRFRIKYFRLCFEGSLLYYTGSASKSALLPKAKQINDGVVFQSTINIMWLLAVSNWKYLNKITEPVRLEYTHAFKK